VQLSRCERVAEHVQTAVHNGHEWFGNSITAADRSDMWIHEGWTTYLESLYVEYRWGKEDAIKYLNGYKPKVQNRYPIIAERGVNANPPQDQYFKGALLINTLRSVANDDARWLKPTEVEAWFEFLASTPHESNNKPLLWPTINKIKSVISQVYAHAQRHCLIPAKMDCNPCRPPKFGGARCKTTSD
jgi:hypothetical protein